MIALRTKAPATMKRSSQDTLEDRTKAPATMKRSSQDTLEDRPEPKSPKLNDHHIQESLKDKNAITCQEEVVQKQITGTVKLIEHSGSAVPTQQTTKDSSYEDFQPPDSPAAKKGIRRRSSFACGRRSQIIPTLDTTAKSKHLLHQNISTDLPSCERLEQLHKDALEVALMDVEKSFPNFDGMQQFQVTVRDKIHDRIKGFRSDGLFTAATSTNTSSSDQHPSDSEPTAVKRNIKQGEDYLIRLQKESKEWDELLENMEQKKEEAIRAFEEMTPIEYTERPASLTTQQNKFLDDRPDYQSVLDSLNDTYVHTHKQVTEFSERLSRSQDYITVCRDVNLAHVKRLGRQLSSEDPRLIIQQFLENN